MPPKSKKKIEEFEYRAEMQQLLHLIIHSLYTHQEIFLRELISNSSDALNKIRFRMLTDKEVLDVDEDLRIKIEIDPKAHSFSLEDSGIGMTKEELVKEIGTVAHSGTLEYLKKIQEEKQSLDGHMIGQFGVGFYSVFMVSDEVVVETRHGDKDSKGFRWKSAGGKYTIEEIAKKNRGTKISFKLKKDSEEFAEDFRIKQVIKKYSNFVDFPIYVKKEQVNRVTALWQEQKNTVKDEELDEFYKFISNDFNSSLAHLHLSIEGSANFKALIFIPETAPPHFFHDDREKSLQLYSNKIFIQDDAKDLLPEYLRFVKGVVDTEDLPLNVSREWTQNSPLMIKVKNVLTSKILGFLKDLSNNNAEKYKKFYQNFGPLFKTGINSDFSNKDKIVELFRFETTKIAEGELASLKDYVGRMKVDQKEIYYLSGDNKDVIKKNPNLEYFKKNDFEVLLLSEPIDVFTVPSINEYDKKKLVSIDKADIDLKEDEKGKKEALNENLSKSLLSIFKETLGDRVEDVIESKRLVDSPATLVSGKEGMDKQMEKMMKAMNKDFAGSKKILEINTSHQLIKNLSKLNLADSKDTLFRECILQIYDGAVLIDGNLDSPTDYVKRMAEIMEKATK